MHSDTTAFAELKYYSLSQKMAAIWRTSKPRIYCIELDSIVSTTANKEIQDAVDGAGFNGHVKIS